MEAVKLRKPGELFENVLRRNVIELAAHNHTWPKDPQITALGDYRHESTSLSSYLLG